MIDTDWLFQLHLYYLRRKQNDIYLMREDVHDMDENEHGKQSNCKSDKR